MESPVKFFTLVVIFALFAVAFALFEGGPREFQEFGGAELSEEQAREFGAVFNEKSNYFNRFFNWTSCNASVTPLASCVDCHTRLLCLPNNAGIVMPCPKNFLSHCNKGICSNIESSKCKNNTQSG